MKNHYLDELLNIKGVNYSIGAYNQNYFNVKDSSNFIDSFSYIVDSYAVSDKCMKLFTQTKSLQYTNLFEYYATKLANEFFNMLKSICDYVEKLSFAVYQKEVTDELMERLEYFEYAIENIYINSNDELIAVQKYN